MDKTANFDLADNRSTLWSENVYFTKGPACRFQDCFPSDGAGFLGASTVKSSISLSLSLHIPVHTKRALFAVLARQSIEQYSNPLFIVLVLVLLIMLAS